MKVIERKASDNKYRHRDFHISMNMLMKYICEEFGAKALTKYLEQFSREFHSINTEYLKKCDLSGLYIYFKDVYEKEEWPVNIEIRGDVLTISQAACPGISYLREKGHIPIEQYIETYTTVYETMCIDTPYEYIMEKFDNETGACVQRFQRRPS